MPNIENLDDVSFSELMKKSVSELPQLCPDWTDHNAHDPGITFLEMLMWLTEMQRYYLYQITETHMESYLRLLGTEAKAAEPASVLARFFSDVPVSIKKGTVFNIGDIPYRAADDMIIVPDLPELDICGNGGYRIGYGLAPYKGGSVPLYYLSGDGAAVNPMRDGFYPRSELKARLLTVNGETECPVKDGTYGLYQSGFINIKLPPEFDDSAAILSLDIVSEDRFEPPAASCFNFNVYMLVQRDGNGKTMGAEGRVKENVVFSANMGEHKLSAEVCGEITVGKKAEAPEDAFKRFISERQLTRAVGTEDYARIALNTPGVRAELVNVFSKEAGKVSVCVKTIGGALRGYEIKNLRKALFEAKPAGTEIEILTPIFFSARLDISASTDGWAGERKLAEHIKNIFEPLEKCMGALIDMPALLKRIGSLSVVLEIKSVRLRLGKGIELTESDTMKLPEDGLLSLDEVLIR